MKKNTRIHSFRYRRELQRLQQQVEELSNDEPFGMLTRPAFLQTCRHIRTGLYSLIFIDLNDLGMMNLRYGYHEVDRRVKAAFAGINRQDVLVARWFSGDEIVLLLRNETYLTFNIQALQQAAQLQGIGFEYQCGNWQSQEAPIEIVLQVLSNQVCQRKVNKQIPSLSCFLEETVVS